MNYYSHHIGDYRRDTAHLSLLEHGAYRQLLDMYYLSESKIPEETEVVYRRLCARTEEEKKAVDTVLFEFFKRDGGWVHTRCEKEILEYLGKADRARNNGKLGGRPVKTKEVIFGNLEETEEKANHKPLTINHKPLISKPSNPNGLVVHSVAVDLLEGIAKPEKHDCPHQQIIALYHEVLPTCPQIRDWTPARAVQLRARWNENPKRQNLEYWRKFFEYVATCDFLVGKCHANGRKTFFADLEWIVKSANFTKIREGKYANE